MKNLVIVESPAKAKTINKILGKEYVVKASLGHVRDLPEKELGVDLEKDFRPKYVTIKSREKVIKELKELAKGAEKVWLAPDPDREGEAIAWHLQEVLQDRKRKIPFLRVTYNEITAPAIRKAFEEPRPIDQNKVDSQQARRVLDRIVGYKVSPLLWRQVRGGQSAGRVQSVALRLVCEREREILNFKPEEYWILGAKVRKFVEPRDAFQIMLAKINGEKPSIKSSEQARAIQADLEGRELRVSAIIRREITRRAPPAFITSTLQQAASSRLGFTPKRTMQIAQRLYEGIDFGSGPVGLITYMRTDSVALSPVAVEAARDFIRQTFGPEFVPEQPNVYRVKADAQAAHEAIRPTDVFKTPDALASRLDPDDLKLYTLIWERFVACQMAPARIAQRTAEIEAVRPPGSEQHYLFRASTSEVLFPGYMRLAGIEEERKAESKKNEADEEGDETEVRLPPLEEGERLEKIEWTGERKETQPPPRYTEASLIKALEENGVGRPSTYATIISTILERKYVEKDKRVLKPTLTGFKVNDFLVQHLPDLFDVQFTARMEEELDRIEEGKLSWVEMLGRFYHSFQDWVEKARAPAADADKVRGLLEMLKDVREWAPPTRRGKRNYSDYDYVRSVREQFEEGKNPLSQRQLSALIGLVARYRDQIPDFEKRAEALGVLSAVADRARASDPPDEVMREKIAALSEVPFEPPREVKKRIFDDRVFYLSLREQVESGRRLTENQLRHLDQLLQKYAAHIPDFEEKAQRWGITDKQEDSQVAALVDMAKAVTEWRPPAERNGRVWDDKQFVESLLRQYETKKSLSPRQVSALKKLLSRYADKIPDFPNRAAAAGMRRPVQAKDTVDEP
ncbi:MAG: type I DNA topoisomerase [Kiritimatiellae bacterium]|nr:type I DNA topoisomerase [Kiritimatiellia bacterium]MDW8458552.1 type I DNA topoisomerase [Verrucomicrobiota bacterium]